MRVASEEAVGAGASVSMEEDEEEAEGAEEMQWMRSIEGKKWVRKDWREERVEEAMVGLLLGRSCVAGSMCVSDKHA